MLYSEETSSRLDWFLLDHHSIDSLERHGHQSGRTMSARRDILLFLSRLMLSTSSWSSPNLLQNRILLWIRILRYHTDSSRSLSPETRCLSTIPILQQV